MCGIIGGFDRHGEPFGNRVAAAACDRIAHRGPDDQGWFEDDGILVGNRRLSILDLGGGHQPMFSDDGQIAVVQNGEIYNFLELSRGLGCRTSCDTEVILRLYEREGEEFVRQLNGMFAIAIFDRRNRRLLLYRDRLGKKPLYLHDDGRRLLFASEIKSLLAMGIEAQMDIEALDAYLTFNYVPPPRTMFRGVRHLMPGHLLRIDNQGLHERAWWRLDVQPEEREEVAWQDEIHETLRDAVRIRLRSDVPLGAFLSGGIDSSLVVRCMSEQMSRPVQTFCIGVENAGIDDARFADQAAAWCGAEHICEFIEPELVATWPLSVYFNDQPHGDTSFLPTYWVSRLARRQVKVALTGDGSDELFAGYDIHRRFLGSHSYSGSSEDWQRSYLQQCSIFSERDKPSLYAEATRRELGTWNAIEHYLPNLAEFRGQDPINQILGVDVKMLLPGNNLVKPDKMSMAVSLETRAPFMDYRLVELAFRIPGRLKLRDGESKAVLKRVAERILPRSIVHRAKQTFTIPVGEWFKTSLSPFVREALLSGRATDRGLFDTNHVARIIEEHQSGRFNHTRQLRALVALELWNRIFIDQRLDHAPTLEEIGLTPPATSRQLLHAA